MEINYLAVIVVLLVIAAVAYTYKSKQKKVGKQRLSVELV